MFCFQCQETAGNVACQRQIGVCGKGDELAALQDLLLYSLRGIAYWQAQSRQSEIDAALAKFLIEKLFATITRVNYDKQQFVGFIRQALEIRQQLAARAATTTSADVPAAATWLPQIPLDKMGEPELQDDLLKEFITLGQSRPVGVLAQSDEDLRSLREIAVYGLKGIAAYADHATQLGYRSAEVEQGIFDILNDLNNDSLTLPDWLQRLDKCGATAVTVMALLDQANTKTYGNPTPTHVSGSLQAGPGILVTGHDLRDLKQLLEQTQGTGVNIYTHSEMLIANAYPELKKFPHLKGNWGGAWYEQQVDFARFNGPVLFTTNCIVRPQANYAQRIFTTGNAAYPGCTYICENPHGQKDFSPLIAMAQELGSLEPQPGPDVNTGFSRQTLLGARQQILESVRAGKIRKFVVMGGCDGFHKERKYYRDFAQALDDDVLILTAGCAKYRYNRLQLPEVAGLPKVIDAGQCNDSYSLAILALDIQKALGAESLNDLPIVFNISWYEQKSVTVLLALLHLGVKGLQMGPTLPAFISPNVAGILIEGYGLRLKGDVESDIAELVGEVCE